MVSTILIIKIVLFLIGLVILVSLLQFFISIHPPKYTSKTNPSNFNLQYETVSFQTSDKIKIKAWLIPSKSANSTVIIGHGYPFDKSNILPVVKFLYPDHNLLLYDHRYFGESEGKITTVGLHEVKDVDAAIEFVRKKFGKNHPIALYGFSLSASAMLMSKSSVNAVIADSPYADLERMINQVYSFFGPLKYPFVKITSLLGKLFLKSNPKEVSPLIFVKNSKVPILVIHGEKDSQISVDNSYSLKEANPNIELWIVPNADHGESYALAREEYENKVKNFLNSNIR